MGFVLVVGLGGGRSPRSGLQCYDLDASVSVVSSSLGFTICIERFNRSKTAILGQLDVVAAQKGIFAVAGSDTSPQIPLRAFGSIDTVYAPSSAMRMMAHAKA
jgi:hypothetical protein